VSRRPPPGGGGVSVRRVLSRMPAWPYKVAGSAPAPAAADRLVGRSWCARSANFGSRHA
jgi:hypothetical protein